jgi:hypothetical protein
MAPWSVIDYVVIHEISSLRRKKITARTFWSKVKVFNARPMKKKDRWLR